MSDSHPNSETLLWMYGLGWAIADGCFNYSHCVLAWQYRALSTDIPRMIEEEQSFIVEKDEAEQQKDDLKRKILTGLAIAFPAIEAFLLIYYRFDLETEKEHSVFVMWVIIIDQTLVYVSQIVSGYLLVRAVWKIRQFNLSKDSGLNTSSMLIHSASFLLFLLMAVIYMLLLDLWELCFQYDCSF